MRVARSLGLREVRLEEVADPVAGPGEVVCRVLACGVCGSDVADDWVAPKLPAVLGHELAGEVTAVGDGVGTVAVGERVVVHHHAPCGECRRCRRGHETLCERWRASALDPGGFAERVRVPGGLVGELLPVGGLDHERATFVEPLACVIRGQRVAGGVAGKTVAILGSGMSGLLHLLWARSQGATRIVGTDVHPYRLDAARRAGADEIIDAGSATSLPKSDVVIVCTAAPAAMTQAFEAVDRGGTVLVFALVAPRTDLRFPAYELWSRGVSVVPSYAGPPADMRLALEAIASQRVDVASLISHRLPLDRTAEAFRLVAAASDSMKVIVVP